MAPMRMAEVPLIEMRLLPMSEQPQPERTERYSDNEEYENRQHACSLIGRDATLVSSSRWHQRLHGFGCRWLFELGSLLRLVQRQRRI
jgi:hypothetical protein